MQFALLTNTYWFKHHLIIDAEGISFAWMLASVNFHDAMQLLVQVRAILFVAGTCCRLYKRSDNIQVGHGYDSELPIQALYQLGFIRVWVHIVRWILFEACFVEDLILHTSELSGCALVPWIKSLSE